MAQPPPAYVGRFAPSPTGALHLGSLVAAVGSYLDARHHGGIWRVRMEDLDPLRSQPAHAAQILRTLESFALTWDGEILYQSQRTALYAHALEQLIQQGRVFSCTCSRRDLAPVYPGTCRARKAHLTTDTSLRFQVDLEDEIAFEDGFQGPQRLALNTLGDVVIRRRDGSFAYQLAVVVDDADQGVTDVVRGADLLDSTGWQIALQQALHLPVPRHAHLPVVLDAGGEKLSKSRRSLALRPEDVSRQLQEALGLLQLMPPCELTGAPPATLLAWAIPRWPPSGLRGLREITGP